MNYTINKKPALNFYPATYSPKAGACLFPMPGKSEYGKTSQFLHYGNADAVLARAAYKEKDTKLARAVCFPTPHEAMTFARKRAETINAAGGERLPFVIDGEGEIARGSQELSEQLVKHSTPTDKHHNVGGHDWLEKGDAIKRAHHAEAAEHAEFPEGTPKQKEAAAACRAAFDKAQEEIHDNAAYEVKEALEQVAADIDFAADKIEQASAHLADNNNPRDIVRNIKDADSDLDEAIEYFDELKKSMEMTFKDIMQKMSGDCPGTQLAERLRQLRQEIQAEKNKLAQ